MNILPGNMRFGAGQPVKRLEDQRLVTGQGRYIDDKPADGALWLVLLRSPHAHARMLSIDIDPARAMAGVVAIYTGAADFQAARWLRHDAAAAAAAGA